MSATKILQVSSSDSDTDRLIDVPSFGLRPSMELPANPTRHATGSTNWDGALGMVERAAALIKDYEHKLRTLEEDTRAYMLRVAAAQEQSLERTRELEGQLEHLESVLTHTTEELREVRIEAVQTGLKLQNADARLAAADAEAVRNGAYVRQIEELLGEI